MRFRLVSCVKDSRIIIGFITTLIVTISLSGCAKESDINSVICNLDEYSIYPKVMEQILPTFEIKQAENKVYYSLENGSIVEAFDTQAAGALESGIAKYWYPHYLATVIVGVDRDQTDAVVTSWKDLLAVQEEVSFFKTPGNVQMLTAALSYGLEGENYSLEKALALLASLNNNGRLKMNTLDSPMMICYDYQAAALIESGRNIEIIIPSEGTITYEKGLLSNQKLDFAGDIDQVLLDGKYRLLNRKSDLSIYPNEETYSSAVRVADYNHFANITQNVERRLERTVLNSKIFMSIDYQEHLYLALLYMIMVTIWVATVLRRSVQKGISYAAFFTGIILNGWTLVRIIKYQIVEISILSRYLWYSFYIFQLALPLVLLWMAWAIDQPKNETFPPKWWRRLAVLVGILIVFVLTNDLHGLVFHLDLSRTDWSTNYSYGFGYYIVLFVSMANLIVFFAILVKKSSTNPRKKGFILPLAFFLLFIFYNYKYIMRDPFFYQTDITIVTGLFAILMFETCIRSGLIPVNTKYIDFFTRSPLHMQILNKEKEVVMASSSEVILPEEDSLLLSNPILGGYAIWQEDISKLNQLHREIQQSTQLLKEANGLLAEEEKIKRVLSEETAKRQLMEQLEIEISESIKKLSAMVEELPYSENHNKESTRIALLLCFIKRKCNLFFKEKEEASIHGEELIIYMDELSDIARYSNTGIVTMNEVKENFSLRYAILFYSFFYGIADFAVQTCCPTIITHIGTDEEFITLSLLPSEPIDLFKPDPILLSLILEANGKFVAKDLDDTIGFSISFPKGGLL